MVHTEHDEETPIEASGDAIVIADALFRGLGEIADAIRECARALNGDGFEQPGGLDTYLDGSSE